MMTPWLLATRRRRGSECFTDANRCSSAANFGPGTVDTMASGGTPAITQTFLAFLLPTPYTRVNAIHTGDASSRTDRWLNTSFDLMAMGG